MFDKSEDLDVVEANLRVCGCVEHADDVVAIGPPPPLFIMVNFCGCITTDVFLANDTCFGLVAAAAVNIVALLPVFNVVVIVFDGVDNNWVPVGDDFNVNTLPPSVTAVAVDAAVFICVRTV